MRGLAKAPSAGSTEGNGKRRGLWSLVAVFALCLCVLGSGASSALAAKPAVTVEPASEVALTTAKAKGAVNPEGKETNYRFEYISDEAFETKVDAQQRVYAETAEGSIALSFEGQATPPIAANASAATVESALNALSTIGGVGGSVAVVKEGLTYLVTFGGSLAATEVGTLGIESIGANGFLFVGVERTGRAPGFAGAGQTATTALLAGSSSVPISANLESLVAGTTYHLRLLAENADGTEVAVAPNFTTDPATAPVVAINPPSEVKYTTAHLSGSIDPEGGNTQAGNPLPIHWEWQYTPNPAQGWFPVGAEGEGTIAGPAAGQSNPIPVAANLSSLQNGSAYKFRLVDQYAGRIEISPEGNFETGTVSAPIVAADDASAITGFSAHFSGHVTAGNADPAFDSSCNFDYVTDKQFQIDGFSSAQTVSCSPNPVTGPASTEVQANAGGLEPNTAYHLRLRAQNLNAAGPVTDVAANFQTPRVAPGVQTLPAGQSGANAAVLAARVNPHNSTTTYRFEWGTDTTYGNFVPAAVTPLGASDNSSHFVSAPISGLQEGATYHFRVVATNTETNETSEGPDRAVTTISGSGPSSCPNEQRRAESNSLALPDCRGYELVTPTAKDFPFGAPLSGNYLYAAAEGSAVSYDTSGPLPGSAAGTYINFNIGRRSDTGWVTMPISPPQNPVGGGENYPKSKGFTNNLSWFFLQGDPPLAPGAPKNAPSFYLRNADTGDYELVSVGNEFAPFWDFVGASDDSKHIVFQILGSALLPGMPGGFIPTVYEWSGGKLHYVGILPNGTPAEQVSVSYGAVSADGNRVVFTDGSQLYDRIENTHTIHISASQRTVPDPSGPRNATYRKATDDGGKVFFTSPEKLTNDATTGNNDAGNDLYVYDLDLGTLTDLSVDTNPADSAKGADVNGVIGTSDDGQYVYFVAGGDLDGGAVAGAPNLYVSHGNQVKFIATLDPADGGAWSGGLGEAQVAANGDLVIQSIASLTGYDNVDPASGTPTSQIYRYATASGQLACLSCRASGAPPSGSSTLTIPGTTTSGVQRNITDDGSRVFFNSTDAIVPGDINGKIDAYEWSAGSAHLISDGTNSSGSAFYDASPSGEDVFFTTRARLVGQDTDSHEDVYDARAGGGFAKPPAAPVPCEGEACRGAGSNAPAAEAPVTPGFVGPGNPQPKKANSKKQAKARKSCKSKHSKKQRKKCESQVKKRFANKSGRGK